MQTQDFGSLQESRIMQHCSRVIHYDMGYKSFDFHSLRHTHTTNRLSHGATPKDVQELLGHSDVSTTLQIYAHLTEKMQNRTVEILNRIPLDDSCTPNLPERGTEAAVFTPDFDFVLPCEKSKKSSIYKASIKTPLYLSVSEDRKCASTACPLVFLHFSHDTDMGEVDVDLLLRMSFVPFTALMDNNLGYKGVQDLRRQFCNPGVLFG